MAYKKLIKVSNVCQLFDKRKFLATQTVNGITFTNNGDGTITVNGTATGRAAFRFVFDRVIISKGAKLRFNNALDVEAYNKFWVEVKLQYTDGTDKYISDVYSPSPPIKDVNEITGYVIVNEGETVNATLTPQLYNLTEMYGAGNEPTTVEQFRQDFPDEMYDYSPHCWLTSYKRVFMTGGGNCLTSYQRNLTCKTKNLFDISKAKVNMQNDGSFIPTVAHNDHFYSMNVKAGETYTVSYYTTSFGSIGSGLNLSIQTGDFYRDGVMLFLKLNPKEQYAYQKGTFTIPDGANKITFSSLQLSYYYNFMIELGDTATDYVPYGHL